ncbi:hypothetical protein AB833_17465 [Chromatiales bacterium (ex Bugula neritina AB1)]|nr:hypothetical protein AB833_17465 [Chromatiales bacterium (ex Bugula neritina AB1)]
MFTRNKPSGFVPAIVLLVVSAFGSGLTQSAELLVLEEKHCPYCQKFNREIAPFYHKTDEGQQAPLRRILLTDPWPEDLGNVTPDTATPTFILVHNHHEVGRIRGYQGDEFFWFLLSELINKIPEVNASPDGLQQK